MKVGQLFNPQALPWGQTEIPSLNEVQSRPSMGDCVLVNVLGTAVASEALFCKRVQGRD
ncbi:hypothetical protein [Glutamicibacter sp. MCAF14]|uniref:hypothetical protein n=1 Tax=Glutamicibacter sp. MCAF14 TaxID=3233043 RepID=UPI003F8F4C98